MSKYTTFMSLLAIMAEVQWMRVEPWWYAPVYLISTCSLDVILSRFQALFWIAFFVATCSDILEEKQCLPFFSMIESNIMKNGSGQPLLLQRLTPPNLICCRRRPSPRRWTPKAVSRGSPLPAGGEMGEKKDDWRLGRQGFSSSATVILFGVPQFPPLGFAMFATTALELRQ